MKQEISEYASTAFEEEKVLNKSYIQSKVKVGKHLKEVLEGSLK